MIAAATAVSASDTVLALLILAWFVAFCFYVDWDIREECAYQACADTPYDWAACLLIDRDNGHSQEHFWVASKSSPCVTPEEGTAL